MPVLRVDHCVAGVNYSSLRF